MIDLKTAAGAAKNLAKLGRCWQDAPAAQRAAIAESLAEHCLSEYQAEGVIASWIGRQSNGQSEDGYTRRSELPAPADIRDAAAQCPAVAPARMRPQGSCSLCHGLGRESAWYLITREHWPDGNFRRHKLERLPIDAFMVADAKRYGLQDIVAYSLMCQPRIEGGEHHGERWADVVDGFNQTVQICSSYCSCDYGRHLKQASLARKAESPERLTSS